jgi:adenylylsulfate kinase
VHALLINGTVGAGKTSVAESIGQVLGLDGVPHAVIDFDWLRRAWPAPVDDRFNERLALVNLASMAQNFADANIDLLVIAGVVETLEHRRAIAVAIGGRVWSCRLTVDATEGEARLRDRHSDDAAGLAWHLYRFGELDATLRDAQVDDVVVDTTGERAQEVARRILELFDARADRSEIGTPSDERNGVDVK